MGCFQSFNPCFYFAYWFVCLFLIYAYWIHYILFLWHTSGKALYFMMFYLSFIHRVFCLHLTLKQMVFKWTFKWSLFFQVSCNTILWSLKSLMTASERCELQGFMDLNSATWNCVRNVKPFIQALPLWGCMLLPFQEQWHEKARNCLWHFAVVEPPLRAAWTPSVTSRRKY